MVEGYVDVIAMVGAGYEGAVAPLGTALTEEQLGLLWKMADEPLLCFDGDSAGRRAAYRAVDLALPQLLPGKSLRFASLPEGHDPDDLIRAGGRDAINEVLSAAQPLAQVLWMRETEASSFDTPERRAAFEARLSEVAGSIGEESVRRHYRQEFTARLRRLFEGDARPAPKRNYGRSERWGQGRVPTRGPKNERARGAVAGELYAVASPQLAQSPVHRGHGAAVPRREALILQVALNHPWVLHDHFEDLAGLEFRHAETEKLKAAVIDIIAQDNIAPDGTPDRDTMRVQLIARGLADPLRRVEKAITSAAVWGARPEAGPEDVLSTWNQLVALHRQWHSLIKELKDAEQALGQDASEANYSWLRDVKGRLSVIDGTEALIEGFGAASGRAAQSL